MSVTLVHSATAVVIWQSASPPREGVSRGSEFPVIISITSLHVVAKPDMRVAAMQVLNSRKIG